MTVDPNRRSGPAAFTLLEVLMALALFAVVAAAAAPLLLDAFAGSRAEEAAQAVEEAALALHSEALAQGRRRAAGLSAGGLTPGRPLPDGWRLEVRRLSEPRFRKPREGETWEFNSAGICEPLALRLSGDGQSVELKFDPLTAQSINE